MNCPDPGQEPRKFLDILLTDEILLMIMTETNSFADVLLEENVTPKARIVHVTPKAWMTFIGILFHMGTIPLNIGTRISYLTIIIFFGVAWAVTGSWEFYSVSILQKTPSLMNHNPLTDFLKYDHSDQIEIVLV